MVGRARQHSTLRPCLERSVEREPEGEESSKPLTFTAVCVRHTPPHACSPKYMQTNTQAHALACHAHTVCVCVCV